MSATHSHYDTLDGLRGIAALAVVGFHFTQYQSVTFFYNAPFAVDFFFMLSGFVIAHSYGSQLFASMGLGEYFGKRVIRLYPMFALGTLLGTPALMALAANGQAFFAPPSLGVCSALHTFFLPCFAPFGVSSLGSSFSVWGVIFPANPAAWSLFFEMVAGLSFPLLCRLKTRHLFLCVFTLWAGFLGSGLWLGSQNGFYSFFLDAGWGIGNFLVGFPRALFGFVCGVLLYRIHDRIPRLPLRLWMLYLALALAIAFPFSIKGSYHALAVTFFAPLVVLAGAAVRCQDGFSTKTARMLGRMSYPVYCLHFPVGRFAFLVGEHFYLSSFATIGLALASTLAISFLAVAFVDEPIRTWLSRRLSAVIAARSRRSAQASLQRVLEDARAETPAQGAIDRQRKGSL
ncbi:MAG: acyltransferase [Bdellovibrionales bacterium]